MLAVRSRTMLRMSAIKPTSSFAVLQSVPIFSSLSEPEFAFLTDRVLCSVSSVLAN